MAPTTGIIGAGITGLTLARYLYEQGVEVELYEKTTQPGGVMRSYREDGWLAEAGPNTFLVKSPRVERFLQQTGIASKRIFASEQAQKRYVVRDGKLHPMPTGLSPLLKTDLFPARAKLRLLKEPFVGKAPADRDESVASFVRRRIGPEFLDYALNPFVAGVYAGDPERLSLRHAFPRMHELEQEYGSLFWGQFRGHRQRQKRDRNLPDDNRIFSFSDGLGQLPDLLASHLQNHLHYETEVREIEKASDGSWQLTCLHNGRTYTQNHDSVICTIPLHRLSDVQFGIESPELIQSLGTVYHPPLSVWTLGFHRTQVDHPLDGFGMLVPEKEQRNILGTLFSSTLFPQRAPENHVTLTTFLGGARQPDLAREAKEEQKSLILRDLQDLLNLEGQPIFERESHWSHAIPQFETGYGKIKEALETLEKQNRSLYFVGSFREGPSINDCMNNAIQLGEKLADA